jgi:hypothetical protein
MRLVVRTCDGIANGKSRRIVASIATRQYDGVGPLVDQGKYLQAYCMCLRKLFWPAKENAPIPKRGPEAEADVMILAVRRASLHMACYA